MKEELVKCQIFKDADLDKELMDKGFLIKPLLTHLLSTIPYKKMDWTPPEKGKRKSKKPDTPETLTFKHDVPSVC